MHRTLATLVTRAVAARPVDLAVIVRIEVDDIDMSTSIVLDDLIRSLVCAAANDVCSSRTFDGDCIFADIFKPDELKVAGTFAVDAFLLVGADDDIAKSRAVLENEDRVCFAAFALARAFDAAIVLGPAGVEDFAGLEVAGCFEGDCTGCLG